VTEETFKLTEGLFRFESLGEIEVKGKEDAVLTYKLLSGKEDVYRPRLGAERMIYSEMIGRDKDLDRLELQVMKAVNGEGSIVNIIGEAGIGKSRLVAELKNQNVIKKVVLLEGRAISIGRNLSFHPIIDLLKHWALIREDDSEAAAINKLENAIRQVYQEEMHEVLPFVATLMGMKLSGRYAERVKGIEGEALEKLILKKVRDLLIMATEINPLVIVAEDMHWADTSSIELMESLFRLAESQRILFVNVFRPGHKETGGRIVETIKENLHDYYVEIMLQPLDKRMSEALINNMLDITDLHHAVMDQIVKRADGNPFFIEEVVRSLIDEGAVVIKDGSYEVTEKIDTVIIPHTIHDVLMARIDRLEEKTRNLVKIASVIGRSFFYRILTEVANTVEDIDNKLEYLKDIQLIREQMRMQELEYLFKHALAQKAAYESILLQNRRELHLRVANSIEKVFKEKLHEFYGMLAFHYSSGDDLDKAEEYMVKAGEEALKASASSEALYYYQEALKLYQKKYRDEISHFKMAMLEKNIALAYQNKGHNVDAIEHFAKALEHFGEKEPDNKILILFSILTSMISLIKNVYFPSKKENRPPSELENEIIDLMFKRSISLTLIDSTKFFINSLILLKKLIRYKLTEIKNGVEIFSSASMIFSLTGISFRLNRRMLGFIKRYIDESEKKKTFYFEFSRFWLNFLSGNWDIVYYQSVEEVNLRYGEFYLVSYYLFGYTLYKIERGDFKDVISLTDKLAEISDTYEDEGAKSLLYDINSKYLMKIRKPYEALKEIDKEIAYNQEHHVSQTPGLIYTFGLKANIEILTGDLSGAEKTLNYVKNLVQKESFLPPIYFIRYLMSQFLFDLNMLEKSVISTDSPIKKSKYRKKSLKSWKRLRAVVRKWAGDRTEAFRLMGVYYWILGKQKQALNWWIKSIKEGERLGARLELSRTYLEVGKRLLEPGSKYKELDGVKAKDYLDRARKQFIDMDLQWDLDKL
jgi:tetratricopeptide (TPR) repeat protein